MADCYADSLKLAAENNCSSVAFPLISAGVFGCPSGIAIAVATQAIRDFLHDHEMEVYLVVFDHKAFKISSSLFEDVQSYLDARYVEELLEEEYRDDHRKRRRFTEASTYLGDEACAAEVSDLPKFLKPERKRSLEDLLAEVDDTLDFIGRAGYALSHSCKSDIIVEYFIQQGEFDIITINETLFVFEQPLLGC